MNVWRLIIRFAKWYTRRRLLVQLTLPFILLVLIPGLIIYYTNPPSPSIKEEIITHQPTINQTNVMEKTYCNNIVSKGRTLVAGSFAYSKYCYRINSTTYLYFAGSKTSIMRIENTSDEGYTYIFSLPVEMYYKDIPIYYYTIILYGNQNYSTITKPLISLLKSARLHEDFCKYFIPTNERPWNYKYIPEELYEQVCNTPTQK